MRHRVTFEDKVVDALIDKSQIEFPELLVDMEVERMVRQYVERLRRSVNTENELKSILSITNEEKLRNSYRPRATQTVKRNLVIAKLSQIQAITASEEEIQEQIEAFVKRYGEGADEQRKSLNTEDSKSGIRDWIIARKTINFLCEQAQLEDEGSE